ncbi:MAG: hypothetical protein K9K67_03385 [Bacteriovoracaceae bacterium]|nr:hypothetical protein [Bacteriovoracaceae bacterium]
MSPEVKESQRFAEKLMRLLSGRKDQGSWVGKDSNWELIFGFLFFFGGIYFLISFLSR